jgi:hypothetical protein
MKKIMISGILVLICIVSIPGFDRGKPLITVFTDFSEGISDIIREMNDNQDEENQEYIPEIIYYTDSDAGKIPAHLSNTLL